MCPMMLNEKPNPRPKVTPEGDGLPRTVTFVISARDSFSIFIVFQSLYTRRSSARWSAREVSEKSEDAIAPKPHPGAWCCTCAALK
jgi:hypothetical protein